MDNDKLMLEKIYASYGTIVALLISTCVLNLVLGDKITCGFLYLIIASMIVVNSNKFIKLIERGKSNDR